MTDSFGVRAASTRTLKPIASAIAIGALAGLLPAVRASRMPPTVALRTV